MCIENITDRTVFVRLHLYNNVTFCVLYAKIVMTVCYYYSIVFSYITPFSEKSNALVCEFEPGQRVCERTIHYTIEALQSDKNCGGLMDSVFA